MCTKVPDGAFHCHGHGVTGTVTVAAGHGQQSLTELQWLPVSLLRARPGPAAGAWPAEARRCRARVRVPKPPCIKCQEDSDLFFSSLGIVLKNHESTIGIGGQ